MSEQWQAMIRLVRDRQLAQALLISAKADQQAGISAKLARTMLCEEAARDDCTCRSCIAGVDSHPDYSECVPSPRTISKEVVRTAVAGLASGPVWSPMKVIVLRPADVLSREAETFLLKHLEEPPPYVYYLLLTQSPEAIIATIRSRCQHWRFTEVVAQTDGADLLEQLQSEPLTAERVVQAAYWVRQQYRRTQSLAWLRALETAEDVYRQIEANGNEELARAQLLRAWPHS
jgi:DNA polymerase-3 subunit delta'